VTSLLRLLTFLRLVDGHDGVVSLTSVALYVAIGKLATTPSLGMADIAALLLPLLASAHKRHLGARAKAAGEQVAGAVEAAGQAVAGVQAVQEALSGVQAQLEKHGEALTAIRNRGAPGAGGR
jgi:hypothetical protein